MGETNNNQPLRIGLALQGAGASTAFSYGAVTRLLEDLDIDAVTGASGGGMTGLAIAAGRNNAERIALLHKLWNNFSIKLTPMRHISDNPFIPDAFRWPNLPFLESYMSGNHRKKAEMPYFQSCLRDALDRTLTPEFWSHIRSGETKLFVNAAEALPNGELKHHPIPQAEINSKYAIGTSALDFMGAVKHRGKRLRDGAYLRNPDMSGIEQEPLTDIIVITLHGAPKNNILAESQQQSEDARAPFNRTAHIQKAELHGHLAHVLEQQDRSFKLHEIAFHAPRHYRDSARLNNSHEHIQYLYDKGYKAADDWLRKHRHLLGKKDTYIPPASVMRPKRQLRVA